MSPDEPLNDREAAFVREYLLSRKATEACMKAGYSPKSARTNAFRMMAREHVRAAIAREDAKTRHRQTKTLDDLVLEYTKLGFTGMSRFMRIDDNGEGARQVKRIKIKPYDRFHALDKLAQHRGLGADLKDPLDGKGTVASLLKEIMERGTALPVRPQGPLGSKAKTWKN